MFWCCWIFLTTNIHYFVWQIGLLWNIKHPVFSEWGRWKTSNYCAHWDYFPRNPKPSQGFLWQIPSLGSQPSLPGGAVTGVFICLVLCQEEGLLAWAQAAWARTWGFVSHCCARRLAPAQKAQEARGLWTAKALLRMPSWKASWREEVASVLCFSVVRSRNWENPRVLLSRILVRSSALAVAKTQFRYSC